jgi:hypothetical protein
MNTTLRGFTPGKRCAITSCGTGATSAFNGNDPANSERQSAAGCMIGSGAFPNTLDMMRDMMRELFIVRLEFCKFMIVRKLFWVKAGLMVW